MKKQKRYNRHHILAKSKGWSNHHDNIKQMEINEHNALHYLFWTDKIAWKILKLFEIEWTALNEYLKQDLIDVLENYVWDYYKQHCRKWNKYNKSDEIGALFNYKDKNGI